MWPFIDGEYLGQGVDLRQYSAERFLNVLETFYINDAIEGLDPAEQKQNKDRMRAEFMKYTSKDTTNSQGNDTPTTPGEYLEATEEGYYPGLEDGLLGG